MFQSAIAKYVEGKHRDLLGAAVTKVKTKANKAAPTKAAAIPEKKKYAPAKGQVTPTRKRVSAVVKLKVKKVGKSLTKKAAAAKKAMK